MRISRFGVRIFRALILTWPLFARSQVTSLTYFLGDVAPIVIAETLSPDDPADLGDGFGLLRFRFSVLRSEIGRVFGSFHDLEASETGVLFRELTILRN